MTPDERAEVIDIRRKLERIAGQLAAICHHVDLRVLGTGDIAAPDVQEKVDSKTCLFCGDRIDGRVVRGLHEKCYRFLMRKVESGEVAESELLESGKILPSTKGGARSESQSAKLFADLTKEIAEASSDEDRENLKQAHQLALDADAFMRGAVPDLEAIRNDLSARYDDAQKTLVGDVNAPSDGADQAETSLTPEQYRELSRQAKLIAEEADRMAEQVEPDVRRAHAEASDREALNGADDAGPP